mgnify:CR=1 FL=1
MRGKDKEVFVKLSKLFLLITASLLLASCATQPQKSEATTNEKQPKEELVRAYHYGADIIGNNR